MKRNTLIYFASYTFSLLGNGIAMVVFPLLVLAKTGSILSAGILASFNAAAATVVGIFAGVVVDRVNRRTVSIVSDVLSAMSIALLPIVDALWGLNLTWFIVLAVVGSFGDMPGMTARETMLPRLAELNGSKSGALDRLVGIRESLAGALVLLGPSLGGLFVWLFGVSSTVLYITAATSLLAALLTTLISPRAGEVDLASRVGVLDSSGGPSSSEFGKSGDGDSAPQPGDSATSINTAPNTHPIARVFADLAQGWRFLLSQRLVRGATILSLFFGVIIVVLQTTILPAYFTAAELPQLSGMAITGIGLGGLLGMAVFATTVGKVSRRAWFVVGMLGSVVGLAALGSLASPWLVLAGAVIIGLTNSPMSAVLGVATIEATPDQLRGRVIASQNTLTMAAPALISGPVAALAAAFGLSVVGLGLAAATLLTAAIALRVRVFRFPATIDAGEQSAATTQEGK